MWGRVHTIKPVSLLALVTNGYSPGPYARPGGAFTVDVGTPVADRRGLDFAYGSGGNVRHISLMDPAKPVVKMQLPGPERDGPAVTVGPDLLGQWVKNSYFDYAVGRPDQRRRGFHPDLPVPVTNLISLERAMLRTSTAALALAFCACEPDLPQVQPTPTVTAVFDPTASKIPLPNDLVFLNPVNSVCPASAATTVRGRPRARRPSCWPASPAASRPTRRHSSASSRAIRKSRSRSTSPRPPT